MATNTLIQNIILPVFNADETPFHGLALRRFTVESVVMSLGDKITGDVYYPDNNLLFTMQEYVVYNGVKYVMVNPPTIVKEGMVADNSELKGMTKYSLVFYHPMYQLGNMPFSDVAVTSDESRYLSESKKFSWIGKPNDFIAKINKNLEDTQWAVVKSSNFPSSVNNELSDVIPFENATIADALKTMNDTWKLPYVVDAVASTDPLYAQGKRFKVVVGLPAEEIYPEGSQVPYVFRLGSGVGLKNNSRTPRNNKIVTRIAGYGSERNIPYGYPQIIWYGDQTWKYTINNDGTDPLSYPIYDGIVGGKWVKLIKHPFTRKTLMPKVYVERLFNKVSPYAVRVVPAKPSYTKMLDELYDDINNKLVNYSHAGAVNDGFDDLKSTIQTVVANGVAGTYEFGDAHSLQYEGKVVLASNGIISGEMYADDNNYPKFDGYTFKDVWAINTDSGAVANTNYDPTLELIDYYDAVGADYPNQINPAAPSYESHEFEDVYPRLNEEEIVSAVPYNGDKKDYIEYSEISALFTKYIQKAANVAEDAVLTRLKAKIENGNYYANGSMSFGDWWSCTYNLTNDEAFMYFEYKSVSEYNTEAIRFSFKALKQGAVPPAPEWDDTMDDKGEYNQSYFKLSLPVLSFDVYACASITEQMDIYMRSGACIGCTFPVQVDWDDYKLNFFDKDGNFMPDGAQRDLVKYPKSNEQSITVIVQKDINTFGTLMPNRYQTPQAGDEFVFLGISLPLSYITAAERELEDKSKEYMLDNNIYYFDYPVKLSEHFLENHKHILSQIKPNAIMRFEFAGEQKELFIKQVSTKVGFTPLPQYEITLTDNVEVVLNQIGETADRVSRLETLVGMLDQEELKNIWAAVQERLSKVDDDTAKGFIRFMRGLQVGNNFTSGILGEGGVFRMNGDGTSYLEVDKMYVRMKAYFDNIEVKDYQHSSGNRMVTKAGAKVCRVEWVDANGNYIEQLDQNLSSAVLFRCFFKANNGEDTVRNDFVVDANGQQDLIYCNRTVIESGLNKRWYWRAAIAKNSELTADGEAWVDLSVSDCANDSDIPMTGDDIIQLGNRTDADRQGAIVEYVGGEDAPSYQIFQGINTYNLNNKNYISLGYSTQTNRAYMNVYGDAYIGDHQETTFVKYEQVNSQTNRPKLTIKAEVDIQSTFGGQSLQQRVEQYAPPYDDSWIQPAIDAVQAQIDGELDTYYLAGVPSLQLPPVVSTQAHPYDDPWLDGTETAEEREAILNNHVGDLYYDKNTGYVYRFLHDDENEEFIWSQIHDDAISEALRIANDAQYTADGKSTIFLNNPEDQDASKRYPMNYKKGDSWVLPSGSGEVNISNTSTQRKFKYGSILTTDVNMASTGYNPTDWNEKVRYTDDTKYDNFITALLNGMPSGSTEATVEAALNAIKAALNQGTTISGGLVLSTLIGLRDSNSVLWAGINGQYDANALGKGIAGWYGGAMADMGNMTAAQIDAWEAKTEAQKIADSSWAKTLFRFDGSGYLAANNIYWNAGGAMTIKNLQTIYGTSGDSVTINALSTLSGIFLTETYGSDNSTELLVNPQNAFSHLFINRTGNVVTYPSNLKTINDYAVLNFGEMKARFVTVDFFNALFQAKDSSGNTIAVNTANPLVDSIKSLVGFWTESYLSALGQNSSGSGGGGGVDMTTVWTAMGQPTTEQINVTHLSNALASYSTKLETIQNIAVGTGANVGSYVVTRANGSQFTIGACNVVDIADYESINGVLPIGNVMYVYEGMPVEYRRCSRHVSQQTTEVYMIFACVRPNTSSSSYPYPQELYVFKRVSGSSSFIYDETVNWDDAENFIKQLFGYDLYLPLTGGQMASQSLVEDLNADLLDGYHASAFLLKAGGTINDDTDTTIDIYSDGLTFKYSGAVVGSISIEQDAGDYYLDISAGTTIGGNTIIHSGNIGSQSVNYATAAGSAPASDVYSWAKAATKPSYTLDEVTDGSTRKLSNYLPLAGGSMTGGISFPANESIVFDVDSGIYARYSGGATDNGLVINGWETIRMNIFDDNSTPASDVLVVSRGGVAITGALTVGGNAVATQQWVTSQNYFKRIDAVTLPALVSADMNTIYVVPSENPVTGNMKEEWCVVEVLRVSIGNEYVDVLDKGTALGWYPADYNTNKNMASRGNVLLHSDATEQYADDIEVCEVPYDGVTDAEWGGHEAEYGTAYTISGTKYVFVPTGWKAISTLTTTTERRWEKIGGGSGSGTVNQIKVGNTVYNPTMGIVSLPAYPTTLPASDVYAWAKAANKPAYTLDEVSDGTTRKLSNYLPLTGGTLTGTVTSTGFVKTGSSSAHVLTGDGGHASISGLSVAYATSAGAVAWGNVSSKPTTLSGYGITDGLYSTEVYSAQDNITWAQDYANTHTRSFVYNTYGTEWSYLFGVNTNALYGAILKMGYTDRYLRLLRVSNGTWQSSDWEKIYAGYADSAGSVAWTNVSDRPTNVSAFTNDSGYITSSALSGYLQKAGGTMTGDIFFPNDTGVVFDTDSSISSYYAQGGSINGLHITGSDAIRMNVYDGSTMNYNVLVVTGTGASVTGSLTVGGNTVATQTWVGNQGYLTSASLNGYATQTWVGQKYLPLSGGTLTNSGKSVGLEYYYGTTYAATLQYKNSPSFVNGLALVNRVATKFLVLQDDGELTYGAALASSRNPVLHSGNWPSYVGTSSSPVGYASYATSAGSATASVNSENSYYNYINSITESAFATGIKSGFYNVRADSGSTSIVANTSYGNSAFHVGWDNNGNTAGFDFLINDTTSSNLYFRARVGGGGIGSWRTIIDSSNIGSQSVSHASTATTATTATYATYATYDPEGNFLASEDWVQNRGYITSSGSCAYATSAGNADTVDNLHASDLVQIAGTQIIKGIKTFSSSVFLKYNTPHYLRAGGLTGGFFYGTDSEEALAIGLQDANTSFMVVTGTDISAWSNSTWMSASPDIQVKQKSLYVNSLIANGVTPSYNFYVNGKTCLGGASSYYQFPDRGGSEGGAHHILYGSDCDYGVVKIRHTSDIGSGGPGGFSASLAIFDERADTIGGVFQPTFYINRTGATRVPDIMGCDVGGTRIFTIQSGGNVGIGTTSPAYKLDVNGTARIAGRIYADGIQTGYTVINGDTVLFWDGSEIVEGTLDVADTTVTQSYTTSGIYNILLAYTSGTTTTVNESLHTNKLQFNVAQGELSVSGWVNTKGLYIEDAFDSSSSGQDVSNLQLLIDPTDGPAIMSDDDINIFSYVYFHSGFSNSSDARLKDIYDYNALVDVNSIAMAPAVRFTWKNNKDKELHCGSLAQYWYSVMPECVNQDNRGYLSMQYDVIALLASISIAKKVMNHEERITELEKENERLRTELEHLRLNEA